MASQAIKEYDDFAGTNGYLIVDGLDDQTLGGKDTVTGSTELAQIPADWRGNA